MSDTPSTPENPYAAPQAPPLAKLVPAIERGELPPGVSPCHACGEPVPPKTARCPHCGARPLYDGLELVVTALLATGVASSIHVWLQFRQVELTRFAHLLPLGLALAVIWPPVNYAFKKLKRGRW